MENIDTLLKQDSDSYNLYVQGHPNEWPREPALMVEQIRQLAEQPLFKIALKMLDLKKADSVLEIGGGRGDASFIFCRFSDSVSCIDKNADDACGIGAAGKIKELTKSPVKLFLGDFHQTPFQNDSFDKIYVKSAIHHAYDIGALFIEMGRVLRPGGILVVEEPARGSWTTEQLAYRHYCGKIGLADNRQNEQAPTIAEWLDFARFAGFKREKIVYGFYPIIESFLEKFCPGGESVRPDFNFPFKKILLRLLKRPLFNKMISFIIKSLEPVINAWLRFFGWPPFVPHMFTGRLGGFEYYPVLILWRKQA